MARQTHHHQPAKPAIATITFDEPPVLIPTRGEGQKTRGNPCPLVGKKNEVAVRTASATTTTTQPQPNHIGRSKIPYTVPFTILVDTREQLPYTFDGLFADSSKQYRPLKVITERCCLGVNRGDYSIRGFEPPHPERSARLTGNAATDLEIGAMRPTISIERKSKADAASTILGWGDRRDNFKQELAILSGLNFGAIVIECTEQELIYDAPEFGIKSAEENGKTIESSIESWRIEFNRVQWVFCGDRVEAERKVYRLLAKFWEECSK